MQYIIYLPELSCMVNALIKYITEPKGAEKKNSIDAEYFPI
jgi:hypothetical protein